ncbi:MAG: hypothetical protein M1815_003725 [Lichina confinis]|nr:MAG: hypothetical protein M1815_003725 [Lichina confinis]
MAGCARLLPSNSRPFSRLPPSETQFSKRLSLSVAIEPYSGTIPTFEQHARSGSDSAVSPLSAPPSTSTVATPAKPNNFLVILAAQERRVMELKEELHRAESELAELKRQWTMREARRKRDDVRQIKRMETLSPARTSVVERPDEALDLNSPQPDTARRKTMSVGSRASGRKVLAGQKHTRALSLLSPGTLSAVSTQVQPTITESEPAKESTRPPRPTSEETSLSPDTTPAAQRPPDYQPKEAIIRTGKQMAEDFKEGLWSFLDDIRQATVGEEGVYGRQTRPDPSNIRAKNFREQGREQTPTKKAQPGPTLEGRDYYGESHRSDAERTDEKGLLVEVADIHP